MKAIFDGMKNAKVRTALSAILAFLAAAAICVMLFSMNTQGGRGENAFGTDIPQSSESADGAEDESETSDAGAAVIGLAVSEDSTDSQDAEAAADESADGEAGTDSFTPGVTGRGDFDSEMQKGGGTGVIIAAAATAAAALILLFVIHFVSTNKKKNMFLQLCRNGAPVKAIRKQLFAEAFVVVFVFGILGTALGAAVSSPLSSAIMQSRTADLVSEDGENSTDSTDSEDSGFGRGFGGEMPDGAGDFEDGEMPKAGDFEDGEMPDGDLQTDGAETDEELDSDMLQGSGGSGEAERGTAASAAQQYLTACAGGLVFTLAAAALSGIACASPVRRKGKKAKGKAEEAEREEVTQ